MDDDDMQNQLESLRLDHTSAVEREYLSNEAPAQGLGEVEQEVTRNNNESLVEQLEREKRLRVQADQRAEKADQRAEKAEKILNGTYFAAIDQVWSVCSKQPSKEHLTALLRHQCPAVYQATLNAAKNNNYSAANDSQSSRSSVDCEQKMKLWPTDVFGNENNAAHIAHLIPVSSKNASLYDDVAYWAMALTKQNVGLSFGAVSADYDEHTKQYWDIKQKAIHGSKEGARREAHSGLKHSVHNKIRLAGQGSYFDANPCVLVIPALSLHEVKRWNGQESYSAIIMAGGWHDDTTGMDVSVQNVCHAIGMCVIKTTNPDEFLASEGEIELARQLLENVLMGLAHSFWYTSRPLLKNESEEILTNLKNQWANVNAGVTVPHKLLSPSLKVRRVKFAVLDSTSSIPDPLLLAVKAAHVWSTRHRQQMLAGGEASSDDYADSLSLLAEEEYLEMMEQLSRPRAWDSLAAGLGQTHT